MYFIIYKLQGNLPILYSVFVVQYYCKLISYNSLICVLFTDKLKTIAAII